MSQVKTLTSVKSHLCTNLIILFRCVISAFCSQWSCVTPEDVHYFSRAAHRLVESHVHVDGDMTSLRVWAWLFKCVVQI